MKKLNWGIIGLGAIAHKFSEAFPQTTNSILLACASNNSQKLESFKKQFFIEDKFAFKNYEDLINCKEVDIVEAVDTGSMSTKPDLLIPMVQCDQIA